MAVLIHTTGCAVPSDISTPTVTKAPAPTLTSTPNPTPTQTPITAPTSTAEATSTREPSPTPEPAETVTEEPTETPSDPEPTETPEASGEYQEIIERAQDFLENGVEEEELLFGDEGRLPIGNVRVDNYREYPGYERIKSLEMQVVLLGLTEVGQHRVSIVGTRDESGNRMIVPVIFGVKNGGWADFILLEKGGQIFKLTSTHGYREASNILPELTENVGEVMRMDLRFSAIEDFLLFMKETGAPDEVIKDYQKFIFSHLDENQVLAEQPSRLAIPLDKIGKLTAGDLSSMPFNFVLIKVQN